MSTDYLFRPTWVRTFMDVAEVLAQRATCPRLHTACVIVSPDYRILSTGYNGAPEGAPHCQESGCLMEDGHCTRAVHAELNAILYAARRGIAIQDSRMVILHAPCVRCAICIAQAGITEVVYREAYGPASGVSRLADLGVGVMQWDGETKPKRFREST